MQMTQNPFHQNKQLLWLGTEEDLEALLSRPNLIGAIMNDLTHLLEKNNGIDCSCYE
jgi:hypothetical protein